jgi:hypothetical protein
MLYKRAGRQGLPGIWPRPGHPVQRRLRGRLLEVIGTSRKPIRNPVLELRLKHQDEQEIHPQTEGITNVYTLNAEDQV